MTRQRGTGFSWKKAGIQGGSAHFRVNFRRNRREKALARPFIQLPAVPERSPKPYRRNTHRYTSAFTTSFRRRGYSSHRGKHKKCPFLRRAVATDEPRRQY